MGNCLSRTNYEVLEMQIRSGNEIGNYRESQADLLDGMKEALQKQARSHDLRLAFQTLFSVTLVAYIIIVSAGSWLFGLWLLGFVLLFGLSAITMYISETYAASCGSMLFTRYLLVRKVKMKVA